jgi:hypothetical protein
MSGMRDITAARYACSIALKPDKSLAGMAGKPTGQAEICFAEPG